MAGMRLAAVACQVFERELSAAVSRCQNTVTVYWLPQGLHDTPDTLHDRLNEAIAQIEREDAAAPPWRRLDAIALCYGLCGGGTAGLCAGRLPLVLPRTDDCIALLLGSRQRYLDCFHSRRGIYWLSPGWLEFANIPSKAWYTQKLRDYAQRYGQDNAAWLLEQENSWIQSYQSGIYIRPQHFPLPWHEQAACEVAESFGWEFETVQGDSALLDGLLAGDWDDRYLVCPPGWQILQDYDGLILRAQAPQAGS